MSLSNDPSSSATAIQQHASHCVKCGLCLPHCPTYQRTQHEAESPRGRIALMQALAEQQLPLSEQVATHLDQCLGCRACEAACPAKVDYHQLLTTTRQHYPLAPHLPTRIRSMQRVITWLAHHSLLLARTLSLSWPLIVGLIRYTPLRMYQHWLPKKRPRWRRPAHYPKPTSQQKVVGLFHGCLPPLLATETLDAAHKLLRQCGFQVYCPPQQRCCGALDEHAGNQARLQHQAKTNQQAFATHDFAALISLSTGCQPTLMQSPYSFSADVVDIHAFLQQHWPSTLRLTALPKRVLVHQPCSQRFVLKQAHSCQQLLEKIPELSCHTLPTQHCCGAAGSHMFKYPGAATDFAQAIVRYLHDANIDIVVTPNIGCALQLKAQFAKAQLTVPVLHPIVLLAQQCLTHESPS